MDPCRLAGDGSGPEDIDLTDAAARSVSLGIWLANLLDGGSGSLPFRRPNMKGREIMTPDPEVVTPDAPVSRAAQIAVFDEIPKEEVAEVVETISQPAHPER
jgi:CBS domain-containing protein